MLPRHRILSAAAVAVVGVVLGGVLVVWFNPAIERDRQAAEDARRLKQLDATLSLALLGTRHNPLGSFDPIVAASRGLENEAARTLGTGSPAGRGGGGPVAMAEPVDGARDAAARAVHRKLLAIEDFKSSFAVLRNAIAQLSVLAADVAQARPASGVEVTAHDRATVLLLALSRLLVDGDPSQMRAVDDARRALAATGAGGPPASGAIARILEQAQLAQLHTGRVNDSVARVLGIPVGARVDDLVAVFTRRHDRLEARRRLVELGIGLAALASAILAIRVLRTQRQTRVLLEQRVAERTRDLADANQRLTRASRAKTEFLANMSHEIRTPLAAILGFAEVLDDERIEAGERRKITGILRRNGEHLLAILSNILDIAKIEAGKMTVEEISCSPRDIGEEVCSLLRNQAEAKGIKLALRIEAAAVPRRIDSDPTRIRQILVNLVGNAVKFTQRGGVTLALGIEMRRQGPYLKFEVRDSGIGLGPEDLQRIFADFEQADASTTRRFGGTGLGLAICKRLSAVLGGEITVTSAKEQGATFALLLPIKESAQVVENLNETAIVAPRGVAPRAGLRVLVADDSTDIQLLVARFLAHIGAQVAAAADGRQAVAMVLAAERELRPFDLVLMDLHMPEMDGAEAVRALRAAGIDRPVIALTASAYLEDRDRCTEAGYNDFLTKPIDRAQLIQRIATLCRDRPIPRPEVPDTSHAVPDTSHGTAPEVPDTSRGFDGGRLLALVGGDEGAREAVIALFRQDAPALVQAIDAAVRGGDLGATRAGAHKVKGMLLNVCAPAAAEVAAEMENAARAGMGDQLATLSARLAAQVKGICDAMASEKRSAA